MGATTSQLELPLGYGNPAILVGLVAPRQSGKDSVVAIAQQMDSRVVRIALGDFVKAELAKLINRDPDFIENHKEVLRGLIQAYGTDYRRNLCSRTYWIDLLCKELKSVEDGKIVFVSDIRFENEAALIKEHGGLLIRVDRDTRCAEPVDAHESETWVHHCVCDAVVINDGSLADLHDKTRVLMQWIHTEITEIQPAA